MEFERGGLTVDQRIVGADAAVGVPVVLHREPAHRVGDVHSRGDRLLQSLDLVVGEHGDPVGPVKLSPGEPVGPVKLSSPTGEIDERQYLPVGAQDGILVEILS